MCSVYHFPSYCFSQLYHNNGWYVTEDEKLFTVVQLFCTPASSWPVIYCWHIQNKILTGKRNGHNSYTVWEIHLAKEIYLAGGTTSHKYFSPLKRHSHVSTETNEYAQKLWVRNWEHELLLVLLFCWSAWLQHVRDSQDPVQSVILLLEY